MSSPLPREVVLVNVPDDVANGLHEYCDGHFQLVRRPDASEAFRYCLRASLRVDVVVLTLPIIDSRYILNEFREHTRTRHVRLSLFADSAPSDLAGFFHDRFALDASPAAIVDRIVSRHLWTVKNIFNGHARR